MNKVGRNKKQVNALQQCATTPILCNIVPQQSSNTYIVCNIVLNGGTTIELKFGQRKKQRKMI